MLYPSHETLPALQGPGSDSSCISHYPGRSYKSNEHANVSFKVPVGTFGKINSPLKSDQINNVRLGCLIQFIISELKTGEDHWIVSLTSFVMWAITAQCVCEDVALLWLTKAKWGWVGLLSQPWRAHPFPGTTFICSIYLFSA